MKYECSIVIEIYYIIENIEKQIIVHKDLSVAIDDLHYDTNTDFLSGKLI